MSLALKTFVILGLQIIVFVIDEFTHQSFCLLNFNLRLLPLTLILIFMSMAVTFHFVLFCHIMCYT